MTGAPGREIRTTIPADLAALTRLCQQVGRLLEEHAVGPRGTYAVHLVLEELVTNVIKYAYDDAGARRIGVRVALEPGFALVDIEDDGRPFDPSAAPRPELDKPVAERPIGGLGLHLVRQMCDTMDYRREGDKNRVAVRIALDAG